VRDISRSVYHYYDYDQHHNDCQTSGGLRASSEESARCLEKVALSQICPIHGTIFYVPVEKSLWIGYVESVIHPKNGLSSMS
jgi:hypothetical protein